MRGQGHCFLVFFQRTLQLGKSMGKPTVKLRSQRTWIPMPLVLAFVPLQKFPTNLWKVLLQNEKYLALSKMKFLVWKLHRGQDQGNGGPGFCGYYVIIVLVKLYFKCFIFTYLLYILCSLVVINFCKHSLKEYICILE